MATTVDAKLLKSTKFPADFNQRVDMQQVNLEVMKKWIAGKISEILGNEDDVVIELCFNLIEGSRYPDIKKLQIQLTGFLEKDTPKFCQELWKLCLSAQSNAQGVPKELLEAKKLELIQEKIESEKAAEEARRRREIDQRRDREMESIRNRERGRGGARGDWDRGRGGRGVRDFDRRGPRYSRSPPPRRRDSRERSFRGPPPRDIDSYVPGSRGGRRRAEPRRRSPSVSGSLSRSRSRSTSPPPRRRRSPSRSVSPPLHRRRSLSRSMSPSRERRSYRGRGNRDGGLNTTRQNRQRSQTPPDKNLRSPLPRTRKRRRSHSAAGSVSPPKHRPRRNTSSESRSRSLTASSVDRPPRVRKERNDSRDIDEMNIATTGATARKGRTRDERLLTRSNSGHRSLTPPRRKCQSPSRSRSPNRRDGKRHRSIQRYEPASRRRRSSSVSSPSDTRDRPADNSEDDRRSQDRRTRRRNHTGNERKVISVTGNSEVWNPKQQATELREKLLREKIKKMRTNSSSS